MNVKCVLVEKVSQKGNTYICLELHLTDTYKKFIFLDKSEEELLKLYYSKEK